MTLAVSDVVVCLSAATCFSTNGTSVIGAPLIPSSSKPMDTVSFAAALLTSGSWLENSLSTVSVLEETTSGAGVDVGTDSAAVISSSITALAVTSSSVGTASASISALDSISGSLSGFELETEAIVGVPAV